VVQGKRDQRQTGFASLAVEHISQQVLSQDSGVIRTVSLGLKNPEAVIPVQPEIPHVTKTTVTDHCPFHFHPLSAFSPVPNQYLISWTSFPLTETDKVPALYWVPLSKNRILTQILPLLPIPSKKS
jgi:hypothetical protein